MARNGRKENKGIETISYNLELIVTCTVFALETHTYTETDEVRQSKHFYMLYPWKPPTCLFGETWRYVRTLLLCSLKSGAIIWIPLDILAFSFFANIQCYEKSNLFQGYNNPYMSFYMLQLIIFWLIKKNIFIFRYFLPELYIYIYITLGLNYLLGQFWWSKATKAHRMMFQGNGDKSVVCSLLTYQNFYLAKNNLHSVYF